MIAKNNVLTIDHFKGVNDVAFGMSADDVISLLGKAERTTTATSISDETEIPKRTEIRNGVTYFYENEKLVCVSGDLVSPFYIGNERIPFTFLEALRFLKSKSELNFRFTQNTSYVFVDLGIVMYPYEIKDIEAGIPTITKKYRIAVCNLKVLYRFAHYFLKLDEKAYEEQGDDILSKLGEFAETYDFNE